MIFQLEKPHLNFLYGLNPIKKETYSIEKLQELYAEGSKYFIESSVETCYREILRAVYKGRVRELTIQLEQWDSNTMQQIINELKGLFSCLNITWNDTSKCVRVEFPILYETNAL